jgi:hypothetical protein
VGPHLRIAGTGGEGAELGPVTRVPGGGLFLTGQRAILLDSRLGMRYS